MLRCSPVQDSPKLDQAKTPLEAARNGYEFYKTIQSDDGHWAGEYGGPLFLIPGQHHRVQPHISCTSG